MRLVPKGVVQMKRKKKRYNIEITIDCMSNQDAKNLAAFIMYSGFLPVVDNTMISVIAKNVDSVALDYITRAIEEDDRVIGSSFHRTPF